MGVSKIGVPQNGWFIRENHIKMDDLGVKPTIFGNTHMGLFPGFPKNMEVRKVILLEKLADFQVPAVQFSKGGIGLHLERL